MFYPQTMLHWGVQCENRKKNTSAQKHIYHKHMTCNRGNISSSGKQPSGAIYYGAGRRPARQVGGKKAFGGR